MVQSNPSVDAATELDEETLARSEAVTLIECFRAVMQKLETGASGTVPAPQPPRPASAPPPLPTNYELKRLRSQITAVEEDFNVLQTGLAAVLEQAVGSVKGDLLAVQQEGSLVRSDIEALKQRVAAAADAGAEVAIKRDKRMNPLVALSCVAFLAGIFGCVLAANASARAFKNGFVVEVKSYTKPADACSTEGGKCLGAFTNGTAVGCDSSTNGYDRTAAVCSRGP